MLPRINEEEDEDDADEEDTNEDVYQQRIKTPVEESHYTEIDTKILERKKIKNNTAISEWKLLTTIKMNVLSSKSIERWYIMYKQYSVLVDIIKGLD